MRTLIGNVAFAGDGRRWIAAGGELFRESGGGKPPVDGDARIATVRWGGRIETQSTQAAGQADAVGDGELQAFVAGLRCVSSGQWDHDGRRDSAGEFAFSRGGDVFDELPTCLHARLTTPDRRGMSEDQPQATPVPNWRRAKERESVAGIPVRSTIGSSERRGAGPNRRSGTRCPRSLPSRLRPCS